MRAACKWVHVGAAQTPCLCCVGEGSASVLDQRYPRSERHKQAQWLAHPASSRWRRMLRTSPAVSTSSTARPSHSKLAPTESRVSPGSGPVSQRPRPSRRLASVDFPCAPFHASPASHCTFAELAGSGGSRHAPHWAGLRWPPSAWSPLSLLRPRPARWRRRRCCVQALGPAGRAALHRRPAAPSVRAQQVQQPADGPLRRCQPPAAALHTGRPSPRLHPAPGVSVHGWWAAAVEEAGVHCGAPVSADIATGTPSPRRVASAMKSSARASPWLRHSWHA